MRWFCESSATQLASSRPPGAPAFLTMTSVIAPYSGFFYVTKKNPRNTTEKMVFRKYDPVVRKHVEFKEAKIK